MKSKNLLFIIIGILVIIILFQRLDKGCNAFKSKIVKTDTVIVRDTSYLEGQLVQVPIYVPVREKKTKPDSIPKASEDYKELVNQYTDLATDHYSISTYNDSIKLRDSTYPGKDLGSVYIKDQISENEIKSRNISYKLKFPVINNTTTITNTILEKPKKQLYVGLGLTGNQYDYVNGAQVGLLYKTRKDHLYQISAGLQKLPNSERVASQFGVATYWKIKLK